MTLVPIPQGCIYLEASCHDLYIRSMLYLLCISQAYSFSLQPPLYATYAQPVLLDKSKISNSMNLYSMWSARVYGPNYSRRQPHNNIIRQYATLSIRSTTRMRTIFKCKLSSHQWSILDELDLRNTYHILFVERSSMDSEDGIVFAIRVEGRVGHNESLTQVRRVLWKEAHPWILSMRRKRS